MRVHELARELGVRVSVVLDAARVKQIRYVRNASSPVPNADADAIRAHVRGTTSTRAGRAAEQARGGRGTGGYDQAAAAFVGAGTGGGERAAEVAEAAAFLGLAPETIGRVDPDVAATAAALGVEFTGGRASYRRRGHGPGQDRRRATAYVAAESEEPTGIAGEIRRQWGSVTVAQAERLAAAYAAKSVTVEAARAYWAGGLGPYDLDAINQCIRSGLAPADLATLIDGRSVVNRLRGGEPAAVLLLQLPE